MADVSPNSFSNIDSLAYSLRSQDPTVDWDIGGIDRATELGSLMGKQGITSLADIMSRDHTYQKYFPSEMTGGESEYFTPERYEDTVGKQWSTGGDKWYGFLGDYNNDGSYGSNAGPVLQDNNLVGWSARGDGNVGYHLNNGFFNPSWGSSKDSFPELATILGLGLSFVPGMQGFGAALGQGLGLSGTLASVAGNSILGGGLSALGGGEFGSGALAGGLGPLLQGLNVGGAMGITDPYLLKAVNGAVSGGVGSAAQGGDFGRGVISGGLSGGLNQVGAPIDMGGGGDMYDLPGTMSGTDMYGENSATMGGVEPTDGGYYASTGQPQASAMPAGRSFGQSLSNVFNNGIPNFSGGNVPIGDALGGLLGLYERYDARRQNKNLMRSLQDMYSPNSAYAQSLRSTMERKDAASGRRSQYGARETDFMAKMADANMRMAPTLMQLQANNKNLGFGMANSALSLGSLFGVPGFNGKAQTPTPPPMPNAQPQMQAPQGGQFGTDYLKWLQTIGNNGVINGGT